MRFLCLCFDGFVRDVCYVIVCSSSRLLLVTREGLCLVIVAFPGYIHSYYWIFRYKECSANTLFKLCKCAGSSESSLDANSVLVLVLLFVALWFILWGDLFYVLPCVILFLCFFSPFIIAITSLGKERANLSVFRTFVRFVLVWCCRFPLPLGVWEGLRFVIVALSGLFSYLCCRKCCVAAQICLAYRYMYYFKMAIYVLVN